METRKGGAVNYKPNAEVPSEAADVVTEKKTERMTLGRMTKQETRVHRKRALRNKVQKAK